MLRTWMGKREDIPAASTHSPYTSTATDRSVGPAISISYVSQTERRRTIDAALEFLTADFAFKVSYSRLLVKLDLDRRLVVAEKACKGRRQRIFLEGM